MELKNVSGKNDSSILGVVKPLLALSLGEIMLVNDIFDQNQLSLIRLKYLKISFIKKSSHSTKRLEEVKTVYQKYFLLVWINIWKLNL